MLDTDICIFIMRKKFSHVVEKFVSLPFGSVCISSITLAELQFGVANSSYPEKNAEALRKFLSVIHVIHFEEDAASYYGMVRHELKSEGKIIGQMDLLIAAHALSRKLTLVSNNLREFERVFNLYTENWAC